MYLFIGVIPIEEYPRVLIDISGVAELKGWKKDQNLVIYSGTTLTELLDICQSVGNNDNDFVYLKTFYDHVQLVAHIAVRNVSRQYSYDTIFKRITQEKIKTIIPYVKKYVIINKYNEPNNVICTYY